MSWLFGFVGFLILVFGFVVAFGAPYLPTLHKQTAAALDLLDLQRGERLLELGCGDGRVLCAAAKRGWQVVGYELNPLLALFAWLRTRRYGKQVQVVWGNYWSKDWPAANGIFVFLLDRYMEKLDKKIVQKYDGQKIKLVSFAFQIPGKQPARQKDGVYLYIYN